MNIPEGPQALTPGWLTAVLRESGAIASAAVAAVKVEPLGDKGVNSQLARLRLTYQGDEKD
ncbi:MAG: hypothetical protein JSW55_02315, partial [Chloroflexota bacterium]